MASLSAKKRKYSDIVPGRVFRPLEKPRHKQKRYTSPPISRSPTVSPERDRATSSRAGSDGDASPADWQRESSPLPRTTSAESQSSSFDSEGSSSDVCASNRDTKLKKRNDPAAFSASIQKILSSRLSSSKRADPVLARSASAHEASTTLASVRLEAKAKQKLREDKKASLERGRVKDVLLGSDLPKNKSGGKEESVSVSEIQEQERRLRKMAQRGVVKLFNAVRAAQVRGEETAKKARGGRAARDEKIREMGREGFLELVAGGGKSRERTTEMAKGIEET